MLSVSSSFSSKQLLCFAQGQGQKREQKRAAKNVVEFHNHSISALLTMGYQNTEKRVENTTKFEDIKKLED